MSDDRTYEALPLPASRTGRATYRSGRRLVEAYGLRLGEIVWDADEVLWDWTLHGTEMLRDAPRSLLYRDLGHREYYLLKPGVLELIWGMRHASLEAGGDGCMRIWTNGYPWRLWRIAREIPGFDALLAPPDEAPPSTHRAYRRHDGIFYRLDFTRLVAGWLEEGPPSGWSELPSDCRRLIVDRLECDPCDSTFKLPELAQLAGKRGFERSEYLVDDVVNTIERFVASGRRGVHVLGPTPSVGCGAVPNTAWFRPMETLKELAGGVAPAIASALRRLTTVEAPAWQHAEPRGLAVDHPLSTFAFEVPDERVRREWVEPMRRLKRRIRATGR